MARLVTKFKFLKPGDRKGAGGYAKYIATREGVERIDDSQRLVPATKQQEKFIEKILKDFPDSATLMEYADYQSEPNMGNASEFISSAIEDNADNLLSSKTYADYIATRPRAQRFGSHGLFTDDGVRVQLEKVSEELNLHEGNVWTAIISLRREDAERLGFHSGERWRDMLRAQTKELSDAFHIPMADLKWFAAFHNEGHHPHVHLMVYSVNPKEGYLSPKGVEHLRSSLAKEIFAQDLFSVYEKQTEHRNELRMQSKELIAGIVANINGGTYDNPALEQKLSQLAEKLSKTSGKKVYGYLKADVKDLVDSIVDEVASDRRIAALYDLWYEQREEVIRTYTENLPQRVPLSQNKEFKSVRNAVIQEAMGIVLNREQSDLPDDSDLPEPDPPAEEAESAERPTEKKEDASMWSLYCQAKEMLDQDSEDYDPNRAVELLIRAANMGCGVAKYRLGKMFLRGDEVPQNVDYALRWLEESVSEGNQYAEYLLGKTLLRGELVDQDMDLYKEHPDELVYKAKAEKYAKIISKTIILSGMDAASFGQNAYFYDAAEGLLTATILLVAEFCEPAKRHIVSVFKIIQELLAPSNKKGRNQFQQLMALLPNDHKAKWFAGAALNTAEQSMASVMSTALSRLNSFLDSELEQLLCFDTEIDAESFCGEKSAIFIIMPEENPNTFFMISLIIQQLYREILAVADENGGKLKNRCMFFCDEFGTLPKIASAEMMFSASRSRRLQIVPIIQSFSQLDKNYGKEGSEIIVDNTQVTLFGGFAPNSSSAEILSKALGSRTVMSGSVSRSKNDPSQSLQMMERPLLTPDELKSLPKGDFVVMKTGVHPMKVHLKLFFQWGIAFDEEHPYSVPEHGNRKVQYAEKKEIQDGIMMKYHPKEAEEAEAAEKEASSGGQAQQQAEANEPPQSEPPKEKKPKGKPVKTERHDRTAQEALAEVTSDGQA